MRWYTDKGPSSDVVLSSRVRLARNLAHEPFPDAMQIEDAQRIESKIEQALFEANAQMQTAYQNVVLGDLDEANLASLVEKRLISEDLVQFHRRHQGQMGRLMIRQDEAASILIGDEDHLRIQSMRPGLDLMAAYVEADRLATLLGEKLALAYDQTFGFLTACPTNLGTGMRASVLLHLPALTACQKIQAFKRNVEQFNFTLRGAYGEHSRAEGCLYQLSNQTTLGLSEQTILSHMEQLTTEVIRLERHYREWLAKQASFDLKDKLYRNLGVLRYARQISTQEARSRLSDLALMIELGWLQETDTTAESQWIKTVLMGLGSGELQRQAKRPLSEQERDFARATWIRTAIQNGLCIQEEDEEHVDSIE